MPPRQTLVTDERADPFPGLESLPAGSGVLFRHYSLGPDARAALGKRIAAICNARALVLSVAGDTDLAISLGADMVHNPRGATRLPISLSIHDEAEARIAAETRAACVYISPIFATASHPGAPCLGIDAATALSRLAGRPAIAMGGMNARRFCELEKDFAGWAGIDAFA